MKHIGRRIRNARKVRGWTQLDLAKKVGLTSHAQISHIEKGKRGSSLETLTKILKVLGLR